MKKSTKIAVAATSVVMAGTMVFGMLGCDGCSNEMAETEKTVSAFATSVVSALEGSDNLLSGYGTVKTAAWSRAKAYYNNNMTATSEEGKQEKYSVASADTDISGITLNLNIGDSAAKSVSYSPSGANILSGSVKLVDGNTYTADDLKPAWQAFQNMVGCKFNDVWINAKNKVKTAASASAEGERLQDMDIITAGANEISTYSDQMLDLSNYLDEMPNYKKFLEANPIIRLSLTSDATTGAMYYAPYFDGNNDIEKYVLCKTNWIESLLDATEGDTSTTYKSSLETKEKDGTVSHITSYMGTEGYYEVDTLASDGTTVIKIRVNYDAALKNAKKEKTDLGAAIVAAAGTEYDGESGNIVDILNYVIDTKNGEVTGAQLLKITQEYIKVAYQNEDGDSFYTQDGYKLSDVFTGYSAAWDVDLYAAVGRCLVTNPSLLKSGSKGNTIGGEDATPLSNLFLICARQNTMNRMIDTVSLVGELYGVRGLESKNIYSYIDADGNLKDARLDGESYDAMIAFNAFYEEGLVYSGSSTGKNGDQSYYTKGEPEAMTTYDYVNTQTPAGFKVSGQTSSSTYNIEDGYYYTPIYTPISKWDEDGDDKIQADEYFRFTESWRTTKDTGFCVPEANVKDNPDKLRAVLTFIDSMFSSDGQILLSYGPMTNDEYTKGLSSREGFWSNPVATDAQIEADQYFEYEGKKYYSETYYNGSYQPTLTDNVKSAYYGNEVYGHKYDGSEKNISGANKWMQSCTLNYSNFARYVIGSALPIGNKLQSLEFQLTSDMGRSGALVVNAALDKGVIKHTKNEMAENPFYTVVPTVLPYSESEQSDLDGKYKKYYDNTTGSIFSNNSADNQNLYWNLIVYGANAEELNKTDALKNNNISIGS